MSTLIQDLATYQTSHDYQWLVNESRKQSIICIVDYKLTSNEVEYKFRDLGKTIYFEKNGNESWQISCRGMSYLTAFNEQDFIKLCIHNHVEFFKP